MNIKIRPGILLGIVALVALGFGGLAFAVSEVAVGATVGIVGLLPKLVDSEEKTQNGD